MTTHTHQPHQSKLKDDLGNGFDIGRGRLIAALILIALGIVFLLGQTGRLNYASSWWVLFIAIPGFVILGGAVKDYIDRGEFTSGIVWQAIGGIIALILSAIFIWDPTWSFTRGWNLELTFPFLRDVRNLWPWMLVAIGLFLLYRAWVTRSSTPAWFGVVLAFVGSTFILNISWGEIWPLVIIAVGAWLLVARSSVSD